MSRFLFGTTRAIIIKKITGIGETAPRNDDSRSPMEKNHIIKNIINTVNCLRLLLREISLAKRLKIGKNPHKKSIIPINPKLAKTCKNKLWAPKKAREPFGKSINPVGENA